MLIDLLRSLFNKKKHQNKRPSDLEDCVDSAAKCMAAGDVRGAIKWFRSALEIDPYNVNLLNDLGSCLADIGDDAGAKHCFDLAYSLNDGYIPAMVNRSKILIDQGQSHEALPTLQRVKVLHPEMADVNAVYAAYCMAQGDAKSATLFHKAAWLGNFEKMRFANSYLFHLAYSDSGESILSAEHQFWADTVRPVDVRIAGYVCDGREGRRIRIGYWSPDLRNHSVRYFFRPLLVNHDINDFEIYVYHDGPKSDAQTELIKGDSEHFFETFQLNDQDLCNLLLEHRLDVLVELAGHSSYNRISLLQGRFSDVQITALGYPPTTGLKSIDAKIVDSRILTDSASHFYTEKPVALPTSFWCYDPMEPVPEVKAAPCRECGFVTFGCVGNISKISDLAILAWVKILDLTPGSKLLLRAINFRDSGVINDYKKRLLGLGFDEARLVIKEPAGGVGFYESYNEIDIILDTYPFNGGTTTCFAAYMGVPVVTMSGESLVSRMGKSIMTNLGYPELVVNNWDQYVEVAVNLASDKDKINAVRLSLRDRFKSTSLGDGRAYARDFEQACMDLIREKSSGYRYESTVSLLPERELLKRAYKVMSRGPSEAACRLVEYLQLKFPKSDAVAILTAQHRALSDFLGAVAFLSSQLPGFVGNVRTEALIVLAGWYLQLQDWDKAAVAVRELGTCTFTNSIDRMHAALLGSVLGVSTSSAHHENFCCESASRTLIVIVTNSEQDYRIKVEQITSRWNIPSGVELQFKQVQPHDRMTAYAELAQCESIDHVVLLHEHAEIGNADFLHRALSAMNECDAVSFAGAKRWQYLDWSSDAFENKCGGWIGRADTSSSDQVEIICWGVIGGAVAKDLQVLHGAVMVVRRSCLETVSGCREDLLLSGILLEQYMSYIMHNHGKKLGACPQFGVVLSEEKGVDQITLTEAKLSLVNEFGIDVFAEPSADDMPILVAVRDVPTAVLAINLCGPASLVEMPVWISE